MPSPGPLRRFRPPLGPRRARRHARLRGLHGAADLRLADRQADRRPTTTAPSALARAAQALAEFEVEGISTTLPLFREMVASEPAFRAGVYTTAYLDEAAGRLSSLSA